MFWGRIKAKKQKNWAGRMWFWFIPKTTSTASSLTGALVAAGSLQPCQSTQQLLIRKCCGCQESNIYCYFLHFGVVGLFVSKCV